MNGRPDSETAFSMKDLVDNARWSMAVTWSTNRGLTAGLVIATLLGSLIPAGSAVVARSLVNEVVGLIKGSTPDVSAVLPWLALGLGFALLDALVGLGNSFIQQALYDDLNIEITLRMLRHASSLDLATFEDPRVQDIRDRAEQNTARHFIQFVSSGLDAVTGVVQVVSLTAVLAVIEPVLTLALLPLFAPYLIFQWRLSRARYSEEYSRTTKRRWTRYYVSRLTNHQTVPEVRLLDLAPFLIRSFRELMEEFRVKDRRLYRRGLVGGVVFAILTTTAYYLAFARVALRAAAGVLTVGDVAVYGGAAVRLRNTLESVVRSASLALEQALYISNLREYLAIAPGLRSTGTSHPTTLRAEIVLDQVSFTYPGSTMPAVSDVSFRIRPGETVALVGENGAGKSTLAKLISRLYDPDRGRILFDGIDLREWDLDYLYHQVSCVFQNFGRYEATVAENIAFGDWSTMLGDRARIEAVARLANVDDMVRAMPQGYDTLIGRMFGEYDLSGGQWQRLAVARAFARDAALLILDEPTSNLDARAEYDVFSRFRELAHGRTTVLISHRFSTVRMADRILVLAAGRIVESGTHKALIARGGHYASLYELHRRQLDTHAADE
jgi:ATP-binding cassette subfamily B protein